MKTKTQPPLTVSLEGGCENRCCFCERTDLGNKDVGNGVGLFLQRARPERLVIQGREPALFEGLHSFVERAVAKGYTSVRLETCGQAPAVFAASLNRAGINEICVMLPAHNATLYEKIAGNALGYEKCKTFIQRSCEINGLSVSVSVPVCEDNIFELNAIIAFASNLGVRRVTLDMSETYKFWPPEQKKRMLAYVHAALDFGVARGLHVSLMGTRLYTANIFEDERVSKEEHNDFCLLTYFSPGRGGHREIFSADIRLTYRCNQRCVFCAVHERQCDEPSPNIVRKTLAEILKKGIRRICFEGGEPTLLAELPEFLGAAKRAGVRDIVLMTNGQLAAEPGYVETLRKAGANRVFVSLHAHTAAMSEDITGTPYSFDRTISGIHNFLATGMHTALIFVMTAMNIKTLPDYLCFVNSEFGRIPVLLSMATPYLEPILDASLIPRYSHMEPWLKKSVRLAAELGIPLSAMEEQHRPPDCVLKDIRFLIRNLYVPLENAKGTKGFLKADSCAECVVDNVCSGVKLFYARAHGMSELVPLKGEGA